MSKRLVTTVVVTLLVLAAALVFIATDSSSAPIKTWQALALWAIISGIGFSAFLKEWEKLPPTKPTSQKDRGDQAPPASSVRDFPETNPVPDESVGSEHRRAG
jgi:hypothetical protein